MSKIGKIFGLGKKKTPAPLPPVVTREDPAIELARKKQLSQDLRRGGRGASVLTSGSGVDDEEDKIKRPAARKAKLLGR